MPTFNTAPPLGGSAKDVIEYGMQNQREEDTKRILGLLYSEHAEIYVSSAAATTISSTSEFYQAAGTYTLSIDHENWEMKTNGRLRYIGKSPRMLHIATSFSITCAANNQIIHIGTSKNGSVLTPSVVMRKIGTGADIRWGTGHAMTSIVNGDYLTIVVKNASSAANVTFETANLTIVSMAMK